MDQCKLGGQQLFQVVLELGYRVLAGMRHLKNHSMQDAAFYPQEARAPGPKLKKKTKM
jgi:hypothetical protein